MSWPGKLDAEKTAAGYRWVFNADGGAMHMGGKLFRTKKQALTAGTIWLEGHYPTP